MWTGFMKIWEIDRNYYYRLLNLLPAISTIYSVLVSWLDGQVLEGYSEICQLIFFIKMGVWWQQDNSIKQLNIRTVIKNLLPSKAEKVFIPEKQFFNFKNKLIKNKPCVSKIPINKFLLDWGQN